MSHHQQLFLFSHHYLACNPGISYDVTSIKARSSCAASMRNDMKAETVEEKHREKKMARDPETMSAQALQVSVTTIKHEYQFLASGDWSPVGSPKQRMASNGEEQVHRTEGFLREHFQSPRMRQGGGTSPAAHSLLGHQCLLGRPRWQNSPLSPETPCTLPGCECIMRRESRTESSV